MAKSPRRERSTTEKTKCHKIPIGLYQGESNLFEVYFFHSWSNITYNNSLSFSFFQSIYYVTKINLPFLVYPWGNAYNRFGTTDLEQRCPTVLFHSPQLSFTTSLSTFGCLLFFYLLTGFNTNKITKFLESM